MSTAAQRTAHGKDVLPARNWFRVALIGAGISPVKLEKGSAAKGMRKAQEVVGTALRSGKRNTSEETDSCCDGARDQVSRRT